MEKGLVALEQAQAGKVQREEEPQSALEYLQDIYKGRREPDHARMRAAVECLPFEHPKLSSVAIASMDAQSFAAKLDRAIMRSSKLIEGKAIEPPQAE